MFRKVIGILLLVLGISGVVISVAGVYFGGTLIDDIGAGLENALQLTSEGLDTVIDTLALTKDTVTQASEGLSTVSLTAENISQSLEDSRPLLDQATTVTTQDVPDSLEAMQDALPAVSQAAGAIDDALRSLSAFQVERRIFGVPISFDLGIEYDPVVALDQSVDTVGESVEGLPDTMRGLEANLNVVDGNLATISTNVQTIADDLDKLNGNIEDVGPLLDDYIRLATSTNDLIRQTKANLTGDLATFKLLLTILFVWFGLYQLVPLYLAIQSFSDSDDNEKKEPAENREPRSEEIVAGEDNENSNTDASKKGES